MESRELHLRLDFSKVGKASPEKMNASPDLEKESSFLGSKACDPQPSKVHGFTSADGRL